MQRDSSCNMTMDRCIMQAITHKQPRTVYNLIRIVQQAYPIFLSKKSQNAHSTCRSKEN